MYVPVHQVRVLWAHQSTNPHIRRPIPKVRRQAGIICSKTSCRVMSGVSGEVAGVGAVAVQGKELPGRIIEG